MADLDNWGLTFAVRTGSAAFSRRILATGWVKAGYKSVDGHLYRGAQLVPIREEVELFTLLGIPWVAPEAREV